jgi:hypothetical protein
MLSLATMGMTKEDDAAMTVTLSVLRSGVGNLETPLTSPA